jgi:hypothetical protein
MVLDAETLIDRRRLKRRVTFWRIVAAVLGILFIVRHSPPHCARDG